MWLNLTSEACFSLYKFFKTMFFHDPMLKLWLKIGKSDDHRPN